MKSFAKPLLVVTLLAAAGFSAFAGSRMGGDCDGAMSMGMGHGEHRMGRASPEKMQAYMDKRQAELKTALKLTAAQEGAWTTFTTAMKAPASLMDLRLDRESMAKLTTPERIDKMQAMQAERHAAMEQRAKATKAFYATLTEAQKKVFDEQAMRHGRKGSRDGRGGKMDSK